MGKDGPHYASCLNNVALMQKMLGNHDHAMGKYLMALQIYRDTVGTKHSSYTATLANIGVLYKSIAEKSTGLEKVKNFERAEEALSDAVATRVETLGNLHAIAKNISITMLT